MNTLDKYLFRDDDEKIIPQKEDIICFINGYSIKKQGAFAVFFPKYTEYNYSSTLSNDITPTSNIATLTAIIQAIKIMNTNDPKIKKNLVIYIDSEYVINVIQQWRQQWKINGWKKKDGTSVLNLDLIKELDKLLSGKRVIICKYLKVEKSRIIDKNLMHESENYKKVFKMAYNELKQDIPEEKEEVDIKEESFESILNKKNIIVCFTDGSAVNNGKKNAKAGYAVYFPKYTEYNYSSKLRPDELQTNNRAEFGAGICAIKLADKIDPTKKKELLIYTDSQLLINTAEKWRIGWKKNGWKKKDGSSVLNIDLVKELDSILSNRIVKFKYVEAHTNFTTLEHQYNDIVDKMARNTTN